MDFKEHTRSFSDGNEHCWGARRYATTATKLLFILRLFDLSPSVRAQWRIENAPVQTFSFVQWSTLIPSLIYAPLQDHRFDPREVFLSDKFWGRHYSVLDDDVTDMFKQLSTLKGNETVIEEARNSLSRISSHLHNGVKKVPHVPKGAPLLYKIRAFQSNRILKDGSNFKWLQDISHPSTGFVSMPHWGMASRHTTPVTRRIRIYNWFVPGEEGCLKESEKEDVSWLKGLTLVSFDGRVDPDASILLGNRYGYGSTGELPFGVLKKKTRKIVGQKGEAQATTTPGKSSAARTSKSDSVITINKVNDPKVPHVETTQRGPLKNSVTQSGAVEIVNEPASFNGSKQMKKGHEETLDAEKEGGKKERKVQEEDEEEEAKEGSKREGREKEGDVREMREERGELKTLSLDEVALAGDAAETAVVEELSRPFKKQESSLIKQQLEQKIRAMLGIGMGADQVVDHDDEETDAVRSGRTKEHGDFGDLFNGSDATDASAPQRKLHLVYRSPSQTFTSKDQLRSAYTSGIDYLQYPLDKYNHKGIRWYPKWDHKGDLLRDPRVEEAKLARGVEWDAPEWALLPRLRRSEYRDLDALILVASSPEDEEERRFFRDMVVPLFPKDVKVLHKFIFGLPIEGANRLTDCSVMKCPLDTETLRRLFIEAVAFRDIVIGDFAETYRSLSQKTAAMHQWVTRHCPNAAVVIKTDIDCSVPWYVHLKYAQRVRSEGLVRDFSLGFLMGGPRGDPLVRRISEYYVSELAHPFPLNPFYLSGGTRLISGDLFRRVGELTAFGSVRFLPVEDVWLGTALADLGHGITVWHGESRCEAAYTDCDNRLRDTPELFQNCTSHWAALETEVDSNGVPKLFSFADRAKSAKRRIENTLTHGRAV